MTAAWFPQTDVEHAMQHEIETLRAEVERLKACLDDAGFWHLRAENERLREALEEIVTACVICVDSQHPHCLAAYKIADAALQSKG
jgi:regulator of replication initiation timing